MLVWFVSQPALEMAERVEVGDKLDESLAAMRVQGANLFRSQWGGILPNGFVVGESEGVFHVQLQLVVFQVRQQVDKGKESLHRRHLAPAYVQHEATIGKGGVISDFETG